MADIGHIAAGGFGAGAIKYLVTHGFEVNPAGVVPPLEPCIVSLGFGDTGIARVVLLGFAPNPSGVSGGGTTTGAFWLFGDAVVT